MTNPWLEWWQSINLQWMMLNSSVVQRQLAILGLVLVVALVLDRLLERGRTHFLGETPPVRFKIRTILWAAKYPFLVLVLGKLALSIYATTGWPSYTLNQLVNLFWFVTGYALLAKTVVILAPDPDARRITRRILLPLLAILGVLHVIGLLAALWTWASQPVVTMASETVTLRSLWLAFVIAAGFWLVAKTGKTLFLRWVLPRTETDTELANSVSSFVQFAIIVLGLWIAIASLGIQFSNLTLLISALTVGIGFGLQDVIKNVMGGVILLGEGHVRPQEVFKISDETGVVERIGIRSTTVRTWDGSQVIVPNADLIAQKVVDLTEVRRIDITVGISCEDDPRRAEGLLLDIAARQPQIVAEPPPAVYFTNLGASTFDLTLYCYVDDRSDIIPTRSELHYAIVETFRREEVEMAYRQLDLHLRSGPWARLSPPGVEETDTVSSG